MTDDQLKKLQESIDHQLKAGIETHVNGKIRHLTEKVDTYIKEDSEWKERAEPVIQMGQSVQGFGKVSLYIVGFVASVGGAIMLIFKLITKE